jgi:hypothetical protein
MSARASDCSRAWTEQASALSPVIRTIGNDLSIQPLNEGRASGHYFEANRIHAPFKNFPDFKMNPSAQELRPGYSFEGPDGTRWHFEKMGPNGMATFKSTDGRKSFDFSSGYYQAHTYEMKIPLEGGRVHDVRLIVPAKADGSADLKTLDHLKQTISKLPAQGIQGLNVVEVNSRANKMDAYWGETYSSPFMPQFLHRALFRSAATGGAGGIHLFPAGKSSDMTELFRHELGHVIASERYGSTMPDEAWKAAMKSDNRAVSDYGKNSEAEDFAEAVALYLAKDGGAIDRTLFKPSHQKYEARFKLLDEYFRVNPEEKRKAVEQMLNVRRVRVGALTGAVIYVGNEARVFFAPEDRVDNSF